METLKEMSKKERKAALLSVAAEVQKICNFDKADKPPKKGNEKELVEWLTEGYQEIEPDDKLSEEAIVVLKELGIAPASKKGTKAKDEKKAGAKDEKKAGAKDEKKVKDKKVLKDGKASGNKTSMNNYVKSSDRTVVPKKDLVLFFNPLIKSGKHDQRALLEKGMAEFGELAKKSATDFLSYSKNPKYLKFDKLVVVDKKGNLRFEK